MFWGREGKGELVDRGAFGMGMDDGDVAVVLVWRMLDEIGGAGRGFSCASLADLTLPLGRPMGVGWVLRSWSAGSKFRAGLHLTSVGGCVNDWAVMGRGGGRTFLKVTAGAARALRGT